MKQASLSELKKKLAEALATIKEAVDLSVPALKTSQQKLVIALWESFLREFIAYLRNKSKTTGINLMRSISLTKILFR